MSDGSELSREQILAVALNIPGEQCAAAAALDSQHAG